MTFGIIAGGAWCGVTVALIGAGGIHGDCAAKQKPPPQNLFKIAVVGGGVVGAVAGAVISAAGKMVMCAYQGAAAFSGRDMTAFSCTTMDLVLPSLILWVTATTSAYAYNYAIAPALNPPDPLSGNNETAHPSRD
jgi:hypothetical protein